MQARTICRGAKKFPKKEISIDKKAFRIKFGRGRREFLRSDPKDIDESELKVITESISVRCVTNLNVWGSFPL